MKTRERYRGLDALQPMTGVAHDLFDLNFNFALRYLKNLTVAEIEALHQGGIAIGLIFEQGAGDALKGASQGRRDGELACQQALELGVPLGQVIFATVDTDVTSAQLTAVRGYLSAFGNALGISYRLGVYACGTVLDNVEDAVPWLAGATGWSGSKTFDDWVIKQGPTISGGTWEGESWPNIGFPYDPNLATDLDWSWRPGRPPQPQPKPPAMPVLKKGDQGEAVWVLQAALNGHPMAIDGDFGQATDYAVRAFQTASGLTVDGVVGPQTWAALRRQS